MPLSSLEKTLMGVGGVVGAAALALQTRFPWIEHDLQILQAEQKITTRRRTFTAFLVDAFEEHVSQQPQKAMLIYEDSVYTYKFMDQQANRVASVMRGLGLKCGDTAAMMIHNEPAFVWTLLGLLKMGVAVALININLRQKRLSHSILATDPMLLIVGTGQDLQHALSAVLPDLGGLPVYAQGLPVGQQLPQGLRDLDALMLQALPVRPDRGVRTGMSMSSTAFYIYTSGTTGFSKPTYISQEGTAWLDMMVLVDMKQDDILYACLPLFHSAGLVLGLNNALFAGCTVLLRKKFSASHFWSDCRKYNVTLVQYIGEIFRYILAESPHTLDSVHNVRCACGNGLRKDIFEDVQKRFRIRRIVEFFGATEGVTAIYNIANKPGAVGRMSPVLNWMEPDSKVLVQYDLSTATPVRDHNGRCINVKPGETGLYMGRVPDCLQQEGTLVVYKSSQEANEKKLVRNAFKDGDLYFNFGDVLYLDYDYFVYFHDRIGDTFRWKGENVSTTDVANALTTLDFILDANVYGVTVPGHEGRASMAALSLTNGSRLSAEQLRNIFTLCQADLPGYARPLFLRVLRQDVLTGTYKQDKVRLREEGYDLSKVKDDLYCLDHGAATYCPLTPERLLTFLSSRL